MLQCKSNEQPLCSFVLEIWNNNGKVDQSFFERFEQNGLIINRFSADCGVRGYCRQKWVLQVQIILKFSNERTCKRNKDVQGLSCGFEDYQSPNH